jgi:hypothetical protein
MYQKQTPIKGKPIGFLMGGPRPQIQGPPNPYQSYTPPFGGGAQFPPQGGPGLPSTQGGSGLLQGLMGGTSGGKGSFDIASAMANAQKMIGIINQVGPIVKNISPMLQLLKGINVASTTTESNDLLTEIEDDGAEKKKRRRKRRRRVNRKSTSKGRKNKKR